MSEPHAAPRLRDWVAGARVRTLPAALAPVIAGTGAAIAIESAHLGRALLAGGVALALQIGVNFANDYSDGVRGTDDHRVGPQRLTASGAVRPGTVKRAAFAAFGVAGVLGLALCAWAGAWWLLAVGAVCILAAWFYTGGTRPYGYRGLGEVAVFVFFGLVATIGTTYTQALTVTMPTVAAGASVGLVACALLMINNVRDIETDTVAGKHTLAVRLGDRRARMAYVVMLSVAIVLAGVAVAHAGFALLGVAVLILPAVVLSRQALQATAPPALIGVLKGTGSFELGLAIVIALGLGLG